MSAPTSVPDSEPSPSESSQPSVPEGIAGLYPAEDLKIGVSPAEREMHRRLRAALPKGWVAWHSLHVWVSNLIEGEGDFVIAVPNKGVMVIEVKGGNIEFRDDSCWYQNDRRFQMDPINQARRYSQKLTERLQGLLAGAAPPFALGVAFPGTLYVPRPGDYEGRTLAKEDMAYLREALESMAERAFEKRPPTIDNHWIKALHTLWRGVVVDELALVDRIRLRNRRLLTLDEEQRDLLEHVNSSQRMLVAGGPGTGKTLLAREICTRLSRRGLRTLLLCSTDALAAGLRAEGLRETQTLRRFAVDLLREEGFEVGEGKPATQWTAETWDGVCVQAGNCVLPLTRQSYDAIVLDESQDLTANDWEFVRALAEDKVFWVFGDQGQGFWSDRCIPKGLCGAQFELKKAYRCPQNLARFADRYRPNQDASRPSTSPAIRLSQQELRIVSVVDESALENAIAEQIGCALAQGARMDQIAVLSLAGRSRTSTCAGNSIGNYVVVRADDLRASDAVVADTFLRFKGLERPWIIICELAKGSRRYDVRMHIALSRALLGVVVIGTPAELQADKRLAALLPSEESAASVGKNSAVRAMR